MTGVFGYVVKESKVLLIKRGTPPYILKWSLPGGGTNSDEDLENACIREVKEETGIDVEVLNAVASARGRVFLCKAVGGVLRASPPESLSVKWVPFHEVTKINNLVPFIKDFLESRFTFGGEK